MANAADTKAKDGTALDFLARHVCDLPNISHTRYREYVQNEATETAINFALAGEVGAATRMLEIMRAHGMDLFRLDDGRDYLQPAMYFAWESTSWPEWIPAEARSESRLLELEERARKPWLERFDPPWNVDVETAQKALAMADQNINKTFPDLDARQRIIQGNRWYEEGQYGFASNPIGPFSANYYLIQTWWQMGIYPYPYMQLFRSAGLTIAFDIYLRLGNNEADQIFRIICNRISFFHQAFMLSGSRTAWRNGFFAKQGHDSSSKFLRLLQIDPVEMAAVVSRGVEMLEKRLAQGGPARPFKGKTIAQLVRLVSAHTFDNCAYDQLNIYGCSSGPHYKPISSNEGLLHPPCSESAIAALESRLGTDLPADYKEFLSTTNGVEPFWDGGFLLRLLAPVDEVRTVALDFFDSETIRLDLLEPFYDSAIEWPPFPKRAISLSGSEPGGGSSGDLWLIDRDATARAKDAFFRVYDDPDLEDARRQKLQTAVQEHYGSIYRFRNLDRALIGWDWWRAEFVPHDGTAALLEAVAEQSLHQAWRWDHCFIPNHRLVGPNQQGPYDTVESV